MVALEHLLYSAINVLYNFGNDRALKTLTGFDHVPFRALLNDFSPLYARGTPYIEDGLVL